MEYTDYVNSKTPVASTCFLNLKELLSILNSFQIMGRDNHLLVTHWSKNNWMYSFQEDFDFATTKKAREAIESKTFRLAHIDTYCKRLSELEEHEALSRATLFEIKKADGRVLHEVVIANQDSLEFDNWNSYSFPVKYQGKFEVIKTTEVA